MGIYLHSAAVAYGRRDNEIFLLIPSQALTWTTEAQVQTSQIQTKSRGKLSAAPSLAKAPQHSSWRREVLLYIYALFRASRCCRYSCFYSVFLLVAISSSSMEEMIKFKDK